MDGKGRGEERRIIARNGMNVSQEANDTSPSHPLPHPELQVVLAFPRELCAVGPACPHGPADTPVSDLLTTP